MISEYVEEFQLSELIHYKNNAKLHPEKQIDQIAKSIMEFGFNDPIAIDENWVIIEGHGRAMAAEKIGLESIPVIILKGLTEKQKKAYILAHNKMTINTGFDFETLKIELESLQDDGFDMDLTGFDDIEIGDMIDEIDMISSDGEMGGSQSGQKGVSMKTPFIFGKISFFINGDHPDFDRIATVCYREDLSQSIKDNAELQERLINAMLAVIEEISDEI